MSEYHQVLREGRLSSGYDFNSPAEIGFNLKSAKVAAKNKATITPIWPRAAQRKLNKQCFIIRSGANTGAEQPTHIALLLSDSPDERGWSRKTFRGPAVDSRGWHEIVRIEAVNDDSKKMQKCLADESTNKFHYLVFVQETRQGVTWPKFYGVFAFDVNESSEEICVYRKISDSAECPKSETGVQ